MTPRERLLASLRGEAVLEPAYAVYDWFVENRDLDWSRFFDLGLGRINHATVTRLRLPHLDVAVQQDEADGGRTRRETVWTTDAGVLREVRVGEWRQRYFVQGPDDYRVLARAFEDAEVIPAVEEFARSEDAVGDGGITLAVPSLRRTPFQSIQIDYAGLERFSFDLAAAEPVLLALVDRMNDLFYREIAVISRMPVEHVKLWENLSLETMGPVHFRRHLVPVYRRLFELLGPHHELSVHYDGKLRQISTDIANLPFFGIDSFTQPPEGDMETAEARAAWPGKYLWLHPCLGWYGGDEADLVARVRAMGRDAGGRDYCLMISEDVPHDPDRTIPRVLEALAR